MRLLVTGGRDYADRATVRAVIGNLRPDTLIHGAARGADMLCGEEAADIGGIDIQAVPADWQSHGKAAGVLRNQEMLAWLPDLVVAFPGGKGTEDMVRRAKAAGLVVLRVDPTEGPLHANNADILPEPLCGLPGEVAKNDKAVTCRECQTTLRWLEANP